MTYSLQISDYMITTMQEQREAASKAAKFQMLKQQEKKREDYAFRRQFDEKPSIIPGCPGLQQQHEAASKVFKAAELFNRLPR